jgi:hypothetical protein
VLGTYAEVAADEYYNGNENPLDYFDKLHRRITYDPGKNLCILFQFTVNQYSRVLLRDVLRKTLQSVR